MFVRLGTKLLWGWVGYFGLGLGFWGLGWVSGGVVTASTIFNNISSTANSAICVASRQVGLIGLVCGGGWVFFGVVGGFVDARFLSSNLLPSLEIFMQTISNFFANLACNFSPVFPFYFLHVNFRLDHIGPTYFLPWCY